MHGLSHGPTPWPPAIGALASPPLTLTHGLPTEQGLGVGGFQCPNPQVPWRARPRRLREGALPVL